MPARTDEFVRQNGRNHRNLQSPFCGGFSHTVFGEQFIEVRDTRMLPPGDSHQRGFSGPTFGANKTKAFQLTQRLPLSLSADLKFRLQLTIGKRDRFAVVLQIAAQELKGDRPTCTMFGHKKPLSPHQWNHYKRRPSSPFSGQNFPLADSVWSNPRGTILFGVIINHAVLRV